MKQKTSSKESRTTFHVIAILFTLLVYLLQILIIDGLEYDILKMTSPMTFYSDEKIGAVKKLINIIQFNQKLEVLYFVVFVFWNPLYKIIEIIKINKFQNILSTVIYISILIIESVISILIIFSNSQFYSKIIAYNIIYLLSLAIPCHILSICFLVLVWSKFIDDIVVFMKSVVKTIGKSK